MSVEVPAGVSSGTRLRLSGRGESSGRHGHSGDLFVEVAVLPHELFERVESTLIYRATLGISEATLGTRLDVPTIDGDEVPLEIPPGTQPGTVFALPGRGMNVLGRRGRGDLQIVVEVSIPTELSDAESDLLKKWAELRGERTDRPASTG